MLGRGQHSRTVYIIDFGLAKRFLIKGTKEHIPFINGKPLIGTPKYASLNAHLGFEQSRRDDLESLGYSIIYMLKGSLPWQGIKARNEELYQKIMEMKRNIKIEDLCQGCPAIIAQYMHYCRNLNFEEEPNYECLRILFRNYVAEFQTIVYDLNELKISEDKKGEKLVPDSCKAIHEDLNKGSKNNSQGSWIAFFSDPNADGLDKKKELRKLEITKRFISTPPQNRRNNHSQDFKSKKGKLSKFAKQETEEAKFNIRKINSGESGGSCNFEELDIIENKALLGII